MKCFLGNKSDRQTLPTDHSNDIKIQKSQVL